MIVFAMTAALFITLGLWGKRVDTLRRCRRCRYIVDGVEPGSTICPECGQDTSSRTAVRVGARKKQLGPILLGALLMLPAGLLALYELTGGTISTRPSPRLVADLYLGTSHDQGVALNELNSRLYLDTLDTFSEKATIGWASENIDEVGAHWLDSVKITSTAGARKLVTGDKLTSTIQALITHLHHDDIRMNAHYASAALTQFADNAIVPLLEALDSDDWQTRQFAQNCLCQIPAAPVTVRRLEVAIESLMDERSLPDNQEGRFRTSFYNAYGAVGFLYDNATAAEPYLIAATDSDDLQQRFFAAYILGISAQGKHAEIIARVLIPHLHSNTTIGDALYASIALYHTGPAIEPHLVESLDYADRQARSTIELIRMDLHDQPITLRDFIERERLNVITHAQPDPLVVRDPRYVSMLFLPHHSGR